MRPVGWLTVGAATLALAATKPKAPVKDDEPKEKVRMTNTEHLDFPASGLLRIRKSEGELTVEGWDRPDAEITVTKSTKEKFDLREREEAEKQLAGVHVTRERHGDEVVLTTSYARHKLLARPFIGTGEIDVDCVIRVPRNTRLEIDQKGGTVNIDDVRGEMHVEDRQGQIFVHLPQDGVYAIDAKSKIGAVQSDFVGHEHRRWAVEQEFMHESAAAQKLFLRIGFGDITILKTQQPKVLTSTPPEPHK